MTDDKEVPGHPSAFLPAWLHRLQDWDRGGRKVGEIAGTIKLQGAGVQGFRVHGLGCKLAGCRDMVQGAGCIPCSPIFNQIVI